MYNARNILEDYRKVGESLWDRFTGKKDGTLWYYRTLTTTFREIDPSPLTDELGRVVSELERLVRDCREIMSDGYEIGGKKVPDNVLYPWLVGSIARALLFYAQAQAHMDRRALEAIATYYSLFHLGMFLVFACPKHQSRDLRSKIQSGVKNGDDPSPKVHHADVLKFLKDGVKFGVPQAFVDAFKKARDLRNFINYGPYVSWKGSGPIEVDTCAHSTSEVASVRNQLADIFINAVGWACTEGEDNGEFVAIAISEAQGFFAGSGRHYAQWCTDEEAHQAESLRSSLEKEAQSLRQ